MRNTKGRKKNRKTRKSRKMRKTRGGASAAGANTFEVNNLSAKSKTEIEQELETLISDLIKKNAFDYSLDRQIRSDNLKLHENTILFLKYILGYTTENFLYDMVWKENSNQFQTETEYNNGLIRIGLTSLWVMVVPSKDTQKLEDLMDFEKKLYP